MARAPQGGVKRVEISPSGADHVHCKEGWYERCLC
jgi:hypothetical protein